MAYLITWRTASSRRLATACVLVDDFTISGGTLIDAAEQLVEKGAISVTAVVTHGVFAEGSMLRLDASPIGRLITTNTIETQPAAFSDRVRVVSVAPLFAEAIRRIHYRGSISVLFRIDRGSAGGCP